MTVQEAKEVLNNIWNFTDAQDEEKADVVDDAIIEAIECMEEVEQYRVFGTPKEIKIREVSSAQLGKAYLSNLTELREYQSLGTVEELKEAREKQVAKKAEKIEPDANNDIDMWVDCPCCGATKRVSKHHNQYYCWKCGQLIELPQPYKKEGA